MKLNENNRNDSKDRSTNNPQEMPMGLAFQMAMHQNAMTNFAKMTEDEKRQVLEAARSVHSKEGMQSIVEDLGKMN